MASTSRQRILNVFVGHALTSLVWLSAERKLSPSTVNQSLQSLACVTSSDFNATAKATTHSKRQTHAKLVTPINAVQRFHKSSRKAVLLFGWSGALTMLVDISTFIKTGESVSLVSEVIVDTTSVVSQEPMCSKSGSSREGWKWTRAELEYQLGLFCCCYRSPMWRA